MPRAWDEERELLQGTFYKFKSQYGGMEVSDAVELRAITDDTEHATGCGTQCDAVS